MYWSNGTQKREEQEQDQRAQFSQASIHKFSPAHFPIVFSKSATANSVRRSMEVKTPFPTG
jgi:hypothetical protein